MLNNQLQMHLKLLEKEQKYSRKKKTAEVTGDLIGNIIPDKVTRVSKNLPQNKSETNEEVILKERFIPPELRQNY